MKKIDTTTWKEFRVGDLFDAIRGSVKKLQTLPKGNTPVVGAARSNQGVAGYYDVDASFNNQITISCNGVGCGSTFYHNYPFNINGDAIVLIAKVDMPQESKRFLACMLDGVLTRKYSYNEKCSPEKVYNEKILLPATIDGTPDWEYMECYVKDMELRVNNTISMLYNVIGGGENKIINIKEWQDFRVGNLFDIHPTKAYKLNNALLFSNIGKNPVVVNSSYNNGIGGFTMLATTELGNMITFSDTVDANTIFYQKNDFVGYPHIQGLYPIKYKEKWNELSLKFFVAMFRKASIAKGFDYGNKFRRDIASEIVVKLPVSAKSEPDWKYMEDYMRNVEAKVQSAIKQLFSA